MRWKKEKKKKLVELEKQTKPFVWRADDNPEKDYVQCLYKETFCRVFRVMCNPHVCFIAVYYSTVLAAVFRPGNLIGVY